MRAHLLLNSRIFALIETSSTQDGGKMINVNCFPSYKIPSSCPGLQHVQTAIHRPFPSYHFSQKVASSSWVHLANLPRKAASMMMLTGNLPQKA
jgi:hypothetical protein